MKIYARMNPDLWMTPVNSADRQLTAEGEVVGYTGADDFGTGFG